MAEFQDFVKHFSIVPDPQVERTKKHDPMDILFIAVCTVICGGEGFTDVDVSG